MTRLADSRTTRLEAKNLYASDPRVVMLATHLAYRVINGDDCEAPGFSGEGRCIETATAARWQNGRMRLVCDEHAERALSQGALILRPRPVRGPDREPSTLDPDPGQNPDPRVELITDQLAALFDIADPGGEDADLLQSIRHVVSEGLAGRASAPAADGSHVVAVDIDYDDNGAMRSWDVETCRCTNPWRHGRAYLGGISTASAAPGQEA